MIAQHYICCYFFPLAGPSKWRLCASVIGCESESSPSVREQTVRVSDTLWFSHPEADIHGQRSERHLCLLSTCPLYLQKWRARWLWWWWSRGTSCLWNRHFNSHLWGNRVERLTKPVLSQRGSEGPQGGGGGRVWDRGGWGGVVSAPHQTSWDIPPSSDKSCAPRMQLLGRRDQINLKNLMLILKVLMIYWTVGILTEKIIVVLALLLLYTRENFLWTSFQHSLIQ